MSPPLDAAQGLGAAALEPPMPTDPAIDPNAAPAPPGLGAATAAPPPAAPAPEPTASHALLGRLLGSTRKTVVGRMVDRYQKPTVSTAVNRLHQDLKGLATEGEPGRFWYEKSSKRILDYVQGNKDEAHKIAQLIAIYSPQTGVPTNTANAIKSYNRAKSGQAMWAGDIVDRDRTFDTIKGASDYAQSLGKNITKVPLDDSGKRFLFARHNMKGYENIATADRDLKAHLLMNEGIPFEGRKTNNFYRNLMVHIDPTIDQGSTQDLWMARAFGFHDDAVSNATKYDFMEKLTHKLGKELGWKPHQVQAAIWTAMKTRQEAVKDDVMKEALDKGMASMVPGKKGKPVFQLNEGQDDAYSSLMRDRALEKVLDADHIKRSARDFSDFLDANLAHVSWEATPSRSAGHMTGLSDLAPHIRADYHKRISEALQDQDGNDLLAQHLGLLSPGTVEAPGYWMGDVNPASHLQVATTRIKKAGQRPDIDDASKALLDHYANARGLLLKQDGVGYHRPFFNPQVSKANGVEYRFDKDLSADEIKNLGAHIDQIPDTALIPSGPGKMRIIHLGSKDPKNPEGDRIPLDKHQPWHKAVDDALQKGVSGATTARARLFASDGKLRGNDWTENPNGEDYTRRLSAAGRSDVLRFVSDVLAPKVEAVDKAFAREHGLKRHQGIEKAIRSAGSQEGIDLHHGLGRPPRAAGGAVRSSYVDDMEAAGVGRRSAEVARHAPTCPPDFPEAARRVWKEHRNRRGKAEGGRAARAGGGGLDMGSMPYSPDTPDAPGGTAQRGKDALGLIGSGGGSDAPAPGSGRELLGKLANDPNTDGMTRLFAAGLAKSGTFSGQDPTPPAPAVVDPNAKPDYPVIRAGGGRVAREEGGPVTDPGLTYPADTAAAYNEGLPAEQQINKPAPVAPATPSYIKPIDPDARKLSPIGLYSHAADTVWKSSQMKGSPTQFKAMLTKAGVKPDEFKWSGYDQAFAGKNVVTKREVRDHFVQNLPKIQETVKAAHLNEHGDEYSRHPDDDSWSEPKYSDYQLPGGKNYREVVMHLPEKLPGKLPAGFAVRHVNTFTPEERRMHGNGPYTVFGPATGGGPGQGSFGSGHTDAAAVRAALKHISAESPDNYRSSHWDEPNPLLHLRMSDRTDLSDMDRWKLPASEVKTRKPLKILHVEELQSDWGQAARDKGIRHAREGKVEPQEQGFWKVTWPDGTFSGGYHTRDHAAAAMEERAETGVPPAPYIDSTAKWTDLGLKRVLHEAAKGGYDKVVFTPGEEQAKRYDLSQHVDKIEYGPHGRDPSQIYWKAHKDDTLMQDGTHSLDEVSKHLGKEIADKMAKGVGEPTGEGRKTLSGLDLKVGGEGMKGYYDTIVPKTLEKLARQHDPEAKVQLHAHKLPPAEDKSQGSLTMGELNGIFEYHDISRQFWETLSRRQQNELTKEYLNSKSGPVKGHALDITPQMRASILAGQKGYASGGRIAGRIDDHLYRRLRKVVDIGGRYS